MIADASPVSPDEYILRRIPNQTDFIDENLPRPIQLLAFRPTKRDTTGISVFREALISPSAIIQVIPEDKRGTFFIAQLSVADVLRIGLTVIPDPTDVPGHALIPELSWPTYQNDKASSKEKQLELAKKAVIVLRPTDDS